jgi:hypothetical protein
MEIGGLQIVLRVNALARKQCKSIWGKALMRCISYTGTSILKETCAQKALKS